MTKYGWDLRDHQHLLDTFLTGLVHAAQKNPRTQRNEGLSENIPHICHGRRPCKFFLAGVIFYRFNAKNWQFTVYFAVITQKIGNLLCILP